MAKITMLGLMAWKSDLFDSLIIPQAVDRQTLIDNIIARGGEFEVIYPDPDFFSYMVGAWSRKWARTFDKWVYALAQEYEPLYNYDRTEEWTTETKGTVKDSQSGTDGSQEGGTTTSHGETTGLSKVSAYDSDSLVDNAGDESSNDGTVTHGRTTSGTHSTEAENQHEDTEVRKGRAYGNIGVTTSSAMLKEYLDIQQWNVYEHITDVFLREFIIPVYE